MTKRINPFLHLYGAAWKKIRAQHLREHPLCCQCQVEGKLTTATVVDHIKDHKGDHALFFDTNNLQSLCKRHHDIKTCQTGGGFGNKSGKTKVKSECGTDGVPVDVNHHWRR